MSIEEGLLRSVQYSEEHYGVGDYIFREDAVPQFYYQILTGEVKLNSYKEDGKEFIQNILTAGSCFGESMLILEKPSPVNAVALTKCIVLKLAKDQFFKLLENKPALFQDLYKVLSERTSEKIVLMNKLTSENADDLLLKLIDRMKISYKDQDKYSFEIPHTRKQLAAITGLSVETTIRAIKRMEKREILVIRNGKIFY